jgi:hypothetical protein
MRPPQFAAAKPVTLAANTTSRHQVARLMLITLPRKCAGQISATSMDPSDHSPFNAKFIRDRPTTKTAKLGASATAGISSENKAMLIASQVRRP